MKYFICITLCIALTFMSVDAQPSQDMVETFRILTYHEDGAASIGSIDPAHPETITHEFTLQPQPGEYWLEDFASPFGNWIMFKVGRPEGHGLRLYNLETGDTILLLDSIQLPRESWAINGETSIVAWSPNGRWVAFHIWEEETEKQLTFVFDLQSWALNLIEDVAASHHQVSWANNSSHLAMVSAVCDNVRCARYGVEFFDPVTRQSLGFVDLSGGDFANRWTSETGTCDFRWSPDSRFLAFRVQCDGSFVISTGEIYMIDTQQYSLIPVTHLTPDGLDAKSIYAIALSAVWLDSRYLLIGVRQEQGVMLQETSSFSTQTLLFDSVSQTLSQISTQQFSDWALGINNMLAYVAYRYPEGAALGTKPIETYIEISALNEGTLIAQSVHESGCRLQWSPTGRYLAYRIEDVASFGRCNRYSNSKILVFADTRISESSIVQLKDNEGALGWSPVILPPP